MADVRRPFRPFAEVCHDPGFEFGETGSLSHCFIPGGCGSESETLCLFEVNRWPARAQCRSALACPISIGIVYERRTPSPSWGWYALQVETEGNRIAVRFQGEKRIEIDDDVFSGPGQVGLITHADTVAMFDDFYIQIGAVPHSQLPRPAPNRPVPPVMHVAKLFTTSAAFHNPMTTFRRGQPVYWKSVVKDKNGAPVAAAVILVDLLRPDGSRLGTEKRTTGTYGQALFTHQIPATEPPGAYTLRVRPVTHADLVDASYAPATNVISSIAFHVE